MAEFDYCSGQSKEFICQGFMKG